MKNAVKSRCRGVENARKSLKLAVSRASPPVATGGFLL
jgi:hypothetical protein